MLRFGMLWIIVAYTVCGVRGENPDVFCNPMMVKQAWEMCEQVYPLKRENVDVLEICDSLECQVQCYLDALADCDNSNDFLDRIIDYDAKKWNVFYRAFCANREMAQELVENSDICGTNQVCPLQDDFSSSLDSNLLDLYKSKQYEEYRKLLCSTFEKIRDCVNVQQTENCTAERAEYFQDVMKIGNSLSFCPNEDIKHLYTTFGGDTNCLDPKVASSCFPSRVMSGLTKCQGIDLRSLFIAPSTINISESCQSSECNVKCYEEAVGSCHKNFGNLILDPMVFKTLTRAACDKQDELETAIRECKMSNETCLANLANFTSALSGADALNLHGDFEAYKQAICSATSTFLRCADYVETRNCTAEMTYLLEDLMVVSFSFSECGSQNHSFFSKYDYTNTCVVSASPKLVTNTLFVSILTLFMSS